jgi:ferredoxin-NADP reductase
MEFAKPLKYRARLSEKYYLAENEHFLFLKFELVEPKAIAFVAGQYVSFAIPGGGARRSYSIASTPDTMHGFSIVAEMVPGGLGSTFLRALPLGDEVEVLGPLGRFVVDEPESAVTQSKLLFVATGSGIVPIYSMINDLLINKHESRQMRLHWGLRDEASMFWFDNFERLMETYPNFVFDPVLSQPGEGWSLCRGHVQDCLTRDFAETKLTQWHGYVCGNPTMVEQVSALLAALGMEREHIHHEKFV